VATIKTTMGLHLKFLWMMKVALSAACA